MCLKACPLPMKSVDCVAKSLYIPNLLLPWNSSSHSNRSRKNICRPSISYTFYSMGFLITRLIFSLKLQLLILQITERLNSKYNINQRIMCAYNPQSCKWVTWKNKSNSEKVNYWNVFKNFLLTQFYVLPLIIMSQVISCCYISLCVSYENHLL